MKKKMIVAGLLVISTLFLAGCWTVKDYLVIGNSYLEEGKYDSAINYFEQGLEDHPKSEELKAALELAKAEKEQYEIEKDLKVVLSDDGNSVVISRYVGEKRIFIIPSQIQGKPVTIIMDNAFIGKNITSVTIPDSVISIGKSAFENNRLTSVTIPDSVTTIGKSAFEDNQLTSVIIGNSVKTIGESAFKFNQLTSVTIPDSVISIGENAFAGNKLSEVTIGNNVTSIGAGAFSEAVESFWGKKIANQLTSVIIPDSVISIGESAFENNEITAVIIPDGVISIGSKAFERNRLSNVSVHPCTTVGNRAFGNAKISYRLTQAEQMQLTEIQREILINKNNVTNPSTYETFAKYLVTLKNKMPYPFQIALLGTELKSTCDNLIEKLEAEIKPTREKFPEFYITGGTIIDYIEGTEYTTFHIWGATAPVPMNEITVRSLGFRRQASNLQIVVKNSTLNNRNVVGWHGQSFSILGKIYYTGQTTGKNAAGVDLPIFNYTENTAMVPGFGEQGKRLLEINAQIPAISNLYAQYSKELK